MVASNQKNKLRVVPKAKREIVQELYIAVADHGHGEEILTLTGPDKELLPLVALDKEARTQLRRYAQDAANKNGKTVRIISFTTRSVYATVNPVNTTGD